MDRLRYVTRLGRSEIRPEVDSFLHAIENVCRAHAMTLSHEDKHGSFVIEDWDQSNIDWLHDASDNRKI